MSTTRFRPELEGLRGIAVILVIAAHAGIAFPGAAIGPDLFFVLSGYLITGLLLRRLDAGRGIELGTFYARRLRRLLPAAVVAVGLTVGAVALLGDPFALERAAHDGIAALTGTANLRFAITLQDYFAPTEPSVFLPLWSLGVEEQFCLLVPLLVGLAYRAGGRRAVALLVALIAIASTVAAIVLTASDPVWAYYLLPTRAYAIAIGALIALGERRVHALGAPVGLVVLGVILALVPGEEGYPGVVGPLAALASALLIGGMAHGGLIARGIATPPLRLVGRISYSLFLLHWPFLVIPVMYGVEMTPALTALAVTGSITSAIVLYLVVERPFREGRLIGDEPRRIFPRVGALAGTAVLVLASLSVPPVTSAGDPVSSALPIAIAPVPTPSPTPVGTPWQVITPPPALTELFEGPVPADLRDAVRRAATDTDPVIRSGCGSNHNDSARVPICREGVVGGPLILLVGDSHAAHWVPGLAIAAERYGWELIAMTKSSCTFTDVPIWSFYMKKPYTACTAWREAVLTKIARLDPALVIVASGRYILPADRRTHSADYYADGLRRMLRRIDAPLAMIADTPHGEIDIPACLARHRDNVAACVVDRDDAYGRTEPSRSRSVAEEFDIPLIDMGPALCPGDRCAPIVDGTVTLHDEHHLTAATSRRLAPALGVAVATAFARATTASAPPIAAPSAPTAPIPWAPIRIAAGTVTTNGPLPADLRPDLATANRDADDVLRSGCGIAHDGDRPPLCLRGIAGGRKIAIIGTSHAAHWVPAIEVIAARDTYEIRPFVKVNCPFVDHRVFAARLGRPYHECHTWREAVIEAVNAWNPELILIASARHEDLDGQVRGAAESAEAVARLLRRLEAPVAIIADNPYGQVNIPSCLARHREEISACVLPRATTAYGYGTARDLLLAERESLPLIDFTPTFCPNGRCAPIIDGIVVYHDHHHLTVTMSRHLAGPLGAAIAQIIATVAR
jgi:peptidoglycan/LPS O-acetylase OafA/YrhL